MRQTYKLILIILSLIAGLFCIRYAFLNLYTYLMNKTWINIMWAFMFLALSVMTLLFFRWAIEKIDYTTCQTTNITKC